MDRYQWPDHVLGHSSRPGISIDFFWVRRLPRGHGPAIITLPCRPADIARAEAGYRVQEGRAESRSRTSILRDIENNCQSVSTPAEEAIRGRFHL